MSEEKRPFKFEVYNINGYPLFGVCVKCNALVPAVPEYMNHHMEHHWLAARVVIDGGSTRLLPEECQWVAVLTEEELHSHPRETNQEHPAQHPE